MKTLIISLITILLLAGSCQKDSSMCIKPVELGVEHLIPLSELAFLPELLDSVKNRNDLQVARLDSSYMVDVDLKTYIVRTNVIYGNLRIFTKYINFYKHIKNGTIWFDSFGTPLADEITVSLTPTVSYEEAKKIAKSEQKFPISCFEYQLGLYDVNQTKGITPPDYRLVWRFTGRNESAPEVIIDAHSKEIIYSFFRNV